MRKGTSRVILLALVVVMVLLPVSTALAQTTIVLVNPPSQSVDVGQTVTVEIKVDTVTNLYGVTQPNCRPRTRTAMLPMACRSSLATS